MNDTEWSLTSPRRTSQKQRHLAICYGLLGKIVINDDSVLAIVTEVCELLLESGEIETAMGSKNICPAV
jgi:hypothetical protein